MTFSILVKFILTMLLGYMSTNGLYINFPVESYDVSDCQASTEDSDVPSHWEIDDTLIGEYISVVGVLESYQKLGDDWILCLSDNDVSVYVTYKDGYDYIAVDELDANIGYSYTLKGYLKNYQYELTSQAKIVKLVITP